MSDRDCEKCKHHTEKGCDSWDCKFEQGMKRKEIIEMLKVLKEQALKSHNDTAIIDVKKDSFIYVMNVTINSLEIDERYELEYEQIEPCDDAISRQAVLDGLRTCYDTETKEYSDGSQWINYEDAVAEMENLPSVNPQVICPSHGIDCEDCPAYEPKTDVLDKIRAEILDEKEYAYADFEQYKIDYLGADAEYVEDELPQDDFRYGMERCVDIIDKYKAESEDKE